MYRIIVTGAEEYNNYAELSRRLEAALASMGRQDAGIVADPGSGAGRLARCFAEEQGYACDALPADGGKGLREAMGAYAAGGGASLMAFQGHDSARTDAAVEAARACGMPVTVVCVHGQQGKGVEG